MRETTHLYLLLPLLYVVCSPHAHTLLRSQSLLYYFAHSHGILQIAQIKEMTAGTLPFLPWLSEIALNDALCFFVFLIIHTLKYCSKSRSILKTTYLIILFHQIELYQYLNYHISYCIHC